MESMAGSMYTAEYTFAYNSLSCWQPMKPVHVAFAYIAVFSGLFCFVSRAIPSIRWLHAWSGRVYIIAMLWATATSLLIFNHGLPNGTIVSFVFVMAGLTLGWVAIMFHQKFLLEQATQKAEEYILASGGVPKESSLQKLLIEAKTDVTNNKTFVQRFFSLKTLHGLFMLLSWINVSGRAFVTNPAEPFYCYTYPVYKPIDTPHTPQGASSNGTLTPLPTNAPNYSETPWGKTGLVEWGLLLSLVPLAVGALIAAIVAFVESRRKGKQTTDKSSLLDQSAQPTESTVA